MKTRRLDEILLSLGHVTEEQVRRALRAQREQGGRLGSHLVRAGDLDEEQLAEALALQHGVPAFRPDRQRVDADLIGRVPREVALRALVLPVRFNPSNGVLDLVAVDPDDTAAVAEIRRLIRCAEVQLSVAPEATFAALVSTYLPAPTDASAGRKAIELPDLFDGQAEADRAAAEASREGAEALPRVLLVGEQAFLRNFLEPIFEREGWQLVTASAKDEVAGHLRGGRFAHVLVARSLAADLRGWISQREVPAPRCGISEFNGVSAALLDNPAPYGALLASLVQALRMAVEARTAPGAPVPPYELMQADARALAGVLDLGRLAADGLTLAVLLLVTDAEAPDGIAWDATLGHARALRFPWDTAAALEACRELMSERVNLDEFGSRERELALAAQVLAVVWHHHRGAGRGDAAAARATLRAKSGLLARSEVIEGYLRLIERSAEDQHAAARHQVFVVGDGGHDLGRFTARLRHLGYPTVPVADLEEAAAMCARCCPGAVFVHQASCDGDLNRCRTLFAGDPAPRLFALTGEADPSRILSLLDLGFDEVFALPQDLDLVGARLRKSLRDKAEKPVEAPVPGGFGAPLGALPFTDLLQALSQSMKTVRVDLVHRDGDRATCHLERGRLVHAVCGQATGAEAVYAVIAWRDEGSFTVAPVDACPEANLAAPLESILMEGCRLLDESLV